MEREINLKLPQQMVGQILDGLRERQKVWKYTQEYLDKGFTEELCIIEECSSAEEARNIANYYEEIICSIEKQTNISCA